MVWANLFFKEHNMKKIKLLLVSTLIAVVLAGCSSTSSAMKTAEDYFKRGNEYFDAKEWVKAEADYTKSIKSKSDNADAHFNRGLVYYNQKMWDKAQADFTKVIELKPDYTNAYYYRGQVYYMQQSYNKAEAEFTKAIELDQNFASAYAYRASANFYWDSNRRNLEQIVADCNKAIELEPQMYLAYYIRGQVYVYEGDYGMGYDYFGRKENFERAISDFSQALELKGNKDIIQPKIDYAQEKFAYWENVIIAEANRYDLSKFIIVSSPSSFFSKKIHQSGFV
jgi:tetratricopeptide (TPR) repeat protein